MQCKVAFIVFILVVLTTPVLAAATGLNVIPTADVLEPRTASLEFESDGDPVVTGSDSDNFILTQFGVGGGVEFGIDECLNDGDDPLGNIKYRFYDRKPAIAVGLQNITDGQEAQLYGVASLDIIGSFRLHVGAIKLDRTEAMLGLDATSGKFTFMADYISGDDNQSSLGAAVNLTDNISLTYAILFANTGSDTSALLNIAFLTRY